MSKRSGDDVDDFMAGLLSGGAQAPRQNAPAKRPVQRTPVPTPVRRPITDNHPPRSHPTATKTSTQHRKMKKGLKTTLIASFILALLIPVGYFLWTGPVKTLLEPKSPFSQEQQDKMDIPLYYPTKLPGSFKLELNSITQPEPGVLLYAITDDGGKKINITLQKYPEGINLDPLYAALQNVQELDTQFGKVKTGTSLENIDITNILNDRTWIIINTSKSTLALDELTEFINSLKKS